jgi:acyl-CoA synthetase (AMP-forming)/AMP-acid ligase II
MQAERAGGEDRGRSPDEVCQSLGDYVDYWARCAPEREAVVDGERRLTYAQLSQLSDECARGLIAAGVRPGQRVAMLTTPSLEFLAVFLAIDRIGAVWVGLNPRHRLPEFEYVLKDTSARLLIGIECFEQRDFREDLRALGENNALLAPPLLIPERSIGQEFLAPLKTRPVSDEELATAASAVTAASPSCVVYTSGSTGRPKGALLSRRGQIQVYGQWRSFLAIGEIRAVADLPVDHVGGLDRVFYSLMAGGLLVFMRRFRPAELLEKIERERITVVFGELTQWIKCAPLFDQYDLRSLAVVGYAGGPPNESLLDSLHRIAPRVFTGYGMTETSDAVMFTDAEVSLAALAGHNVGRPLPHVLTRLSSPDGEPVAKNGTGMLEVRSSAVFLGYLNRPEDTAAAFTADGWLRTGDLLKERPDGTFDFLGRADHTYKSGGYNIYPREIEIALESHPSVGLAAVVSVPDDIFQAVGHAFVEPASAEVPLAAGELRAHCSKLLASYKLPKTITVLDELPLLRNEKIDRLALKARALDETGR